MLILLVNTCFNSVSLPIREELWTDFFKCILGHFSWTHLWFVKVSFKKRSPNLTCTLGRVWVAGKSQSLVLSLVRQVPMRWGLTCLQGLHLLQGIDFSPELFNLSLQVSILFWDILGWDGIGRMKCTKLKEDKNETLESRIWGVGGFAVTTQGTWRVSTTWKRAGQEGLWGLRL